MLEHKYLVHREKYRPRRVKVLFVAESPPTSGSYFYFPNTNGKDHLFSETMRAMGLWKVGLPMRKGVDKKLLLTQFQSRGYFLVDVCGSPVDKMQMRNRNIMVRQGLQSLLQEVRRTRPNRILIVKSSIHKTVKGILQKHGYGMRVLNPRRPIPFPSHGNQKTYRTLLNRYLRIS